MKQIFSIIFSIALCASLSAQAKEYKGVNFADEIKVGDTTLKLNGTATRTAMSIISVYAGGLYVATPSTDAKAILDAKTPKKIDMHFLMSVEKDKLIDGWNKGFELNVQDQPEYKKNYKKDLQEFYSHLKHMKKGDRVQLTMFDDRVEFQVKDQPVQTIKSPDFSKTMLRVYVDKTIDSGLRDGLLGKKK